MIQQSSTRQLDLSDVCNVLFRAFRAISGMYAAADTATFAPEGTKSVWCTQQDGSRNLPPLFLLSRLSEGVALLSQGILAVFRFLGKNDASVSWNTNGTVSSIPQPQPQADDCWLTNCLLFRRSSAAYSFTASA